MKHYASNSRVGEAISTATDGKRAIYTTIPVLSNAILLSSTAEKQGTIFRHVYSLHAQSQIWIREPTRTSGV